MTWNHATVFYEPAEAVTDIGERQTLPVGFFWREDIRAEIETLYSSEALELRRQAKERIDAMLGLPDKAAKPQDLGVKPIRNAPVFHMQKHHPRELTDCVAYHAKLTRWFLLRRDTQTPPLLDLVTGDRFDFSDFVFWAALPWVEQRTETKFGIEAITPNAVAEEAPDA